MGAITGRAIYEGTLDFTKAQQLCDASWSRLRFRKKTNPTW
jgi:hypothetical protein